MSGTGEYEKVLDKTAELCDTAKRLIAAGYFGISIHSADGHRWIEINEEVETNLQEMLSQAQLTPIRSKVYGSILDALDRVDGALKTLGQLSLLETFESYDEWDAWGLAPAETGPEN